MPFLQYCSAILPKFSLKITILCHSVRSLRSPVALSRQDSEVAREKLTMGSPAPVRRTSGSRPRLPTRMTLLTLPAIIFSFDANGNTRVAGKVFFLARTRRRGAVHETRRHGYPRYLGP
ncbi:MAG: hypothetical protein USCAAHI_00156 [Beijerinckiaceae bacterium]|nr:MAG: hypothetical protein USCAAHI_00156 [Beijerinckiaceae bacterium]